MAPPLGFIVPVLKGVQCRKDMPHINMLMTTWSNVPTPPSWILKSRNLMCSDTLTKEKKGNQAVPA